MKSKNFYDARHAASYLNGTIIRKEKNPIYIVDIVESDNENKRFRVHYQVLGDAQLDDKLLFLPNNEIDMNPVPLGMMNVGDNVFFVSRSPVRGWKVGLDSSNINIRPLSPGYRGNTPNYRSKEMRDTIKGVFPNFDYIMKRIRSGQLMGAFSRRFAVEGGSLRFKAEDVPVGVATRTGPELFDNFQYLQEVLTEDLNE